MLSQALTSVETSFASGDCELAGQTAAAFKDQIDALPADVGEEVKTRLRSGAVQLIDLVEADCQEAEQNTSGPQGTTTTTTSTDEVPPEVPSEEVPSEEVPSQEVPAEEPPPTDEPEAPEEVPVPETDEAPGNSEEAPGQTEEAPPPSDGGGGAVEGEGGGISP